MSERGRVVLHPRVSVKHREIESLREKLGALIEERESLLYGEREILLAKYNRDVVCIEYELFLLQVKIAEVRRRIALLQADINSGKAITDERIACLDQEIRKEFEKAHIELEEKERELRESSLLLDPERWMNPEDARELKTLYRRLCQRYHPDVGGQELERWEQIWSALQHAYRARDLDLLRALSETLDMSGKPLPDTPDALDAEIERLRSRIKNQGERVSEILSAPPFAYREKLNDPQWVEARQRELKQEIVEGRKRRTELRLRYETLLPFAGSVH